MLPDWSRKPAVGSSGWALARLRRVVWLRNNESAYRYIPEVREMVNRAILSCWRDVRDTGDVEAFRQAQRLLVPSGVYR